MGRNNGITLREVFTKYTEIAERQIQVAEAQTKVQLETTATLQKLSDKVESAVDLSKSKMFWIIWGCLVIAGGAIGIKLVFP